MNSARGATLSHQDCEDAIGFAGMFNLDPLHRSGRWIHECFQSCLGIISPRPLKTLDCVLAWPAKTIEGGFEILLVVAIGWIFTRSLCREAGQAM